MQERIYTIREIKSTLKFLLADKPVKKVVLFGSYAKQTATKNSDIDLIVDTDGKLRGFDFIKLVCQIENAFQKKLDCFEQYEIIPGSKMDLEIKNTGVTVYDR